MKIARIAITIMAVAQLFGGFLASSMATLNGTQAEYARQIDSPGVRMLATLILVGAIVLAFIPDREAAEEE